MLYTPPHFLGRRDLAAQLIRAHPFATLITPGAEPIVTHLPLLLVEERESWRLTRPRCARQSALAGMGPDAIGARDIPRR